MDNKLLLLANSLDKREQKSFLHFLEWQTAINTRHSFAGDVMKKLFLLIEFDKNLDMITLQNKIAGKKITNKEWRYMLGDLSNYLQTFLVYRNVYNDEVLYKSTLLHELGKRDCIKPFATLYKDMNARQANVANSQEGFYVLYKAEKNYQQYYLSKQKRKFVPDFNIVSNHLDAYYVLNKLKLFCEMMNYQNVLTAKSQTLFLKEITQVVEENYFKDVKPVLVYYNILMTLTKPAEEKYFTDLYELVQQHHKSFDADELMDFYHYLKNYCTRKINAGNYAYQKIMISIYKNMLANQRLWKTQWLSQWDYKNAVTVGLREKEFAWTKSFIEKYNFYLAAAERKNAFRYNMAALFFSKRNFAEAKKLLNRVNLDDVFYRLDARLMLLKIYFETDDQNTLYYHISAFRKFLHRNKLVSDYQRTIYRNLLKRVSQLVNAFNDKAALKKLNTELKDAKDIADLQWLRAKVDELI